MTTCNEQYDVNSVKEEEEEAIYIHNDHWRSHPVVKRLLIEHGYFKKPLVNTSKYNLRQRKRLKSESADEEKQIDELPAESDVVHSNSRSCDVISLNDEEMKTNDKCNIKQDNTSPEILQDTDSVSKDNVATSPPVVKKIDKVPSSDNVRRDIDIESHLMPPAPKKVTQNKIVFNSFEDSCDEEYEDEDDDEFSGDDSDSFISDLIFDRNEVGTMREADDLTLPPETDLLLTCENDSDLSYSDNEDESIINEMLSRAEDINRKNFEEFKKHKGNKSLPMEEERSKENNEGEKLIMNVQGSDSEEESKKELDTKKSENISMTPDKTDDCVRKRKLDILKRFVLRDEEEESEVTVKIQKLDEGEVKKIVDTSGNLKDENIGHKNELVTEHIEKVKEDENILVDQSSSTMGIEAVEDDQNKGKVVESENIEENVQNGDKNFEKGFQNEDMFVGEENVKKDDQNKDKNVEKDEIEDKVTESKDIENEDMVARAEDDQNEDKVTEHVGKKSGDNEKRVEREDAVNNTKVICLDQEKLQPMPLKIKTVENINKSVAGDESPVTTPKDSFMSLDTFYDMLKMILPKNWMIHKHELFGVQLFMLSNECQPYNPFVPITVTMSYSGSLKVNVRQCVLAAEHELFDPEFKSTTKLTVVQILRLIEKLNNYTLCCGCENEKFEKYWINNGDIDTFGKLKTCRSKNCSLLIHKFRKRCFECHRLSKRLYNKYKRELKKDNDIEVTEERLVPNEEPIGEPVKRVSTKKKVKKNINLTEQNMMELKNKCPTKDAKFLNKYWDDINDLFSTSLSVGAYSRTGVSVLRLKCKSFYRKLKRWRKVFSVENLNQDSLDIIVSDEEEADEDSEQDDMFANMVWQELKDQLISYIKEINILKQRMTLRSRYFRSLSTLNKMKRTDEEPNLICLT